MTMTDIAAPVAPQHAPLTRDVLGALAAADLALATATGLDLPLPHETAAVTPEWLTQTIGADVPGAEVVSTHVDDEHTGMTDRLRLGITWNEAGAAAGLPTMVFVKATPEHPVHRMMLSVLHMAELEATFYRVAQPDVPALAPRAYHAESYPGGRFLIVTEDLATKGCQPFWLKDACTPEHALAVARTLAQVHATFWDSPRFDTDLSWVRPRTQRLGWPFLCQSLGQTREIYLASEAGQSLAPDAQAVIAAWAQHQGAVFDYWETLPKTLLHGDSHFGNTYATSDGGAGYFDWQVIFRGYGVRDLVYFLTSALSADQYRAQGAEILDTYVATLAEHGVTIDREEADLHFGLFALDSLDASMATLAQGTYNHDLAVSQRGLECALAILADHGVADQIESIARTGSPR